MAKLTKKDRHRLIKILNAGKELPLDFKHILFPPERKECELVYAAKERAEDILADTMAVPLQPLKTFEKESKGWSNKLIFGDNLQVMKSLLSDPEVKGRVRLVYIDPPFATKQEFKGSQDQKAYQDKIIGTEFIEFLRKRLIFLRELLSDDGSIYVHLDWKKVHYIKTIMDEIFYDYLFTELTRRTVAAHNDPGTIGNIHDTILFYKKKSSYFNPPRDLSDIKNKLDYDKVDLQEEGLEKLNTDGNGISIFINNNKIPFNSDSIIMQDKYNKPYIDFIASPK